MTKYIFLYKGAATPQDQMTEERQKEIGAVWGAWMGKNKDSIVDIGLPMNADGVSVSDNGDTGKADSITGYSILQAEDMDGAKKLTEGHPFLTDDEGKFSVEIYELLPMPEM